MDALNFVQVIEILNSMYKKTNNPATTTKPNDNKQTKRTNKHSKTTRCQISVI